MLMLMARTRKSIDGFILRPNNNASINDAGQTFVNRQRHGKLDDVVQQPRMDVVVDDKATTPAPKRSYRDNDFNEALLKDIDSSIDSLDDQQEAAAPKRARRRALAKKRLTRTQIIKRIMIVLIIAILAVACYFGYKLYKAGGKMFKGNPISMVTTKTRLSEDSNGRTNVLIFGTSGYSMDADAWDGAMLTDSIMVLSIDQDDNSVYMMSMPRDLYVKYTTASGALRKGKLNEVYYQNNPRNDNDKKGADALASKVGSILGLNIQYYVHADWTALLQMVDAVGGVDVEIESTDPRGIYDSSTKIRYRNGEVAHLNGERALALARARNHNAGDYGLAGGNYDREKNQQKILAALQKKIMSTGTLLNVSAVDKLIDSMGNNLVTSFESSHVQTLIDITKGVQADKIKQLPFVGRADGGPNLIAGYTEGGSYKGEAPVAGPFDYSQIQNYIAENLSSDPVVKEKATVDVLNGSGVQGLANEKATALKKEHYTIGKVTNAPSEVTDEVVIYQRNSDKSGTAKALAKRYGVKVKQGDLTGYTTTADFVVVFGSGSGSSSSRSEL